MGYKYTIKYMEGSICVSEETATNWFTAVMILWIHKPYHTYAWRTLEVR